MCLDRQGERCAPPHARRRKCASARRRGRGNMYWSQRPRQDQCVRVTPLARAAPAGRNGAGNARRSRRKASSVSGRLVAPKPCCRHRPGRPAERRQVALFKSHGYAAMPSWRMCPGSRATAVWLRRLGPYQHRIERWSDRNPTDRSQMRHKPERRAEADACIRPRALISPQVIRLHASCRSGSPSRWSHKPKGSTRHRSRLHALGRGEPLPSGARSRVLGAHGRVRASTHRWDEHSRHSLAIGAPNSASPRVIAAGRGAPVIGTRPGTTRRILGLEPMARVPLIDTAGRVAPDRDCRARERRRRCNIDKATGIMCSCATRSRTGRGVLDWR